MNFRFGIYELYTELFWVAPSSSKKPLRIWAIFCWANVGILNIYLKNFSAPCISYLETTDKNTSACTTNERWHTLIFKTSLATS